MQDEKHKIGQRIQSLRYKRGYTREALAEKSGLSTRFLEAVEAGRKGTGSSTIIKLAAALHTTTHFLLFGSKRREATIELPLNGVAPDEQKRLEETLLKVVELFEKYPK